MRARTLSGASAMALAESCAVIHAAAFAPSGARAWSAAEIEALARKDTVTLFTLPAGFLLLEIVGDEAEILTIAVSPQTQRQGVGRALLDEALSHCTCRKVRRCMLEVATDNIAAERLYCDVGFIEIGRRKGYFKRSGTSEDALVMEKLVSNTK